MMSKQCTKCKQILPLSKFGVDRAHKDGTTSHCSDCRKKYYLRNKIAYNKRSKKDYEENKEERKLQFWKNHLKRKYNLTYKQFVQMAQEQGLACKICKEKFKGLQDKNVHVDHNHKTGKVRGILCGFCNKYLIAMLEHPLKKAGEQYLKENG